MEAQKQFITNAGHELKTPLTAISTSADVLAMEHDGDEWVHNIQVQSGRLSKLITSLVALSRLDEEIRFPFARNSPSATRCGRSASLSALWPRPRGKPTPRTSRTG